jgi:hypothetical protein
MKLDWKEVLGTVAPMLGTAIGGPMGAIAAKAISQTLLGKENATEAEIQAAVMNASPEQLLDLQAVEKQFLKDMKALDVDLHKAAMKDVGDARSTMVKTSMIPQIALSVIFIVGYFWTVNALLIGDIKIEPDHKDMVTILLGVLTAGVANIMQFWFGSSAGSKYKTTKLK